MASKSIPIYLTGYYDTMGEFNGDKVFFSRARAELHSGSWMDIRVLYIDKSELDLFIDCEYDKTVEG